MTSPQILFKQKDMSFYKRGKDLLKSSLFSKMSNRFASNPHNYLVPIYYHLKIDIMALESADSIEDVLEILETKDPTLPKCEHCGKTYFSKDNLYKHKN